MVRFTDTYVEYRTGTRALRGVNMEINDGEFVFIVGPSGAGKSTLTKLFTAELRPTSGTVMVNGFSIGSIKRRHIPALRRTIGVVYQDFKLIDRMTVYDNVAFAMHVVGEHDKAKIRERVMRVLELVGLEGKHMRRPGELSGGEQQRAVIARAIVNNPGMIIADEPTGNLDPVRSFEIMELLVKINELGSTVVVITHERELVDSFEKRVILINEGRVAGDRDSGYVGSMVSDGSELSKTAGFYTEEVAVVAEEPEATETAENTEAAPGADAAVQEINSADDEEIKAALALDEEGTKFFSEEEENPEFLKGFIDAAEGEAVAETAAPADEGSIMAILGNGETEEPVKTEEAAEEAEAGEGSLE